MLLRIWNKARGPLLTILVLAWVAYFDLSNFLPKSAHSDFRFQVVGEAIELLAVVGIFSLMGLLGRGVPLETRTLRYALLVGMSIAALLFAMFWRDFFPNDQFSLRAGAMDFVYAPVVGLAFFWFTYLGWIRPAGPSKEREASVD